MNSLPNAGANLGNIDVGVVKVGTAFVKPLDHGGHFTTGSVKGEDVATIFITRIILFGPVRVQTQMVALVPLLLITAIFFDLVLIHFANWKMVEHWWPLRIKQLGFKVSEGVF